MAGQNEVLCKIKASIEEIEARLAKHAKAINKNNKTLTGLLQSVAVAYMFKYAETQEEYRSCSDIENLIIERKKRFKH